MSFNFGENSLNKLKGVHPDLVKVAKRAIQLSTQDFMITCGVRTLAEQKELYAQGRTKPGNIVTWTLNSRHLPKSDGYSHAIDTVPFPVDWNSTAKFDNIAKAMFAAAKELGIGIRWGADWDEDGNKREKGETDSPHFELDR